MNKQMICFIGMHHPGLSPLTSQFYGQGLKIVSRGLVANTLVNKKDINIFESRTDVWYVKAILERKSFL